MCGIIGVVGTSEAASRILEGLRRLEYRGYDSAGIATIESNAIHRVRAQGRVDHLAENLAQHPLQGTTGIGHTRWATHGAPIERNAHPHGTKRVAVVHNGIIENHADLRSKLRARGHHFESDTDTEVVARLIDDYLAKGDRPARAFGKTLRHLEGSFAIAAIFKEAPDSMACARRGAPLAIAQKDKEVFVGSDALALAPLSPEIIYLEEGDWAWISSDRTIILNDLLGPVNRPARPSKNWPSDGEKGAFRHFMEKELHEYPTAVARTFASLAGSARDDAHPLPFDARTISRLAITGCGSAMLAGHVGRRWIEDFAGIPVDAEIASEFRYRERTWPLEGTGRSGAILVSQSGETADTLAAMHLMKNKNVPTLAVVNVAESALARESDMSWQTLAGPEIGVASTKAFGAQLAAFASLTIRLAQTRGTQSEEALAKMAAEIVRLPEACHDVLDQKKSELQAIGSWLAEASSAIYLGRGIYFPIALEGALKLKEISYVHAEGFAAGEMKHGPIALLEPKVPVIGICPPGPLFGKTASNLQEAAARGAPLVVLTDSANAAAFKSIALSVLTLPEASAISGPIIYALALQAIAYHAAVARGTDVDRPRNLAKSVSVE